MTSTPDTPRERDEKAESLADEAVETAATLADEAEEKARLLVIEEAALAKVLASEFRRFKREMRMLYAFNLITAIILVVVVK
jgi:hypothetical protein